MHDDPFVAPPFALSDDALPDTPALLAVSSGACVFFDRTSPRCRIQHALGHDALPLACRQFPRVAVHDPRGVSITLSHYCPTSAAMLDTIDPVQIVSGAPAFPAAGAYEGLDAREA